MTLPPVTEFFSHFINISHASSFVTAIAELEKNISASYVKGESIRDALIDTAIEYLNSIKNPDR